MIRATSSRRVIAARLAVPFVAAALLAGPVAAGATAVAAPAVPAAGASPADPQNWTVPRLAVMPLGDSITRGAGSSTGHGYRADLRNRLVPHTGNLQFVGSVRTGDADHEGHSGWQIGDLSENVERWLAAAGPNVVLLNIGTNDMDRNTDVDAAPARLGALIDRITTAAPHMTVLVSSLVPSLDAQGQKRVEKFNAAVPHLVEERRKKGLNIGFVDMGAVTTRDLTDRLHPNDAGFTKMADAFYAGLSRAAADGWIHERVDVKPAPAHPLPAGDHRVDINGDGRADYLVVGRNGAVQAWVNKGGDERGGWSEYGQIAAGVGVPGDRVRFADVDGDGRADYLALDDNGGVRAWINEGGDGRGGWKSWGRVAGGVGAPLSQVRFADVNGDRRADYVTVDDNGAVRAWINNGGDERGGWADWGRVAGGVGAAGSKVRFADINGDGKADYLALDDNGAVQAWINNGGDGRGGWKSWGRVAGGVGAPASQVRFADVDGDGRADYVTVDDNGAVRAWINRGGDGRGGWADHGRIATGTGSGADVRI
ncbi:FG-GAP-like repeat-containing protein [Streptomyces sp. NPDC046261]|uniref:FG-GAP-like repeat-containing protein n=1 Tax=Streptomyces sp. NPDC046261 TaxID=3157200 RepID=UPI0033EE4FCF